MVSGLPFHNRVHCSNYILVRKYGRGRYVFSLFRDKVAEKYLDDNPRSSKTILAVLFGIFLIWFMIYFILKIPTIKKAIEIVKTGTYFIGKVPSSLYIPLIVTFVSVIILAIYLSIFVLYYSTGDYQMYTNGIAKTRLKDFQ